MQLCRPSVLRRWENQRMLSSLTTQHGSCAGLTVVLCCQTWRSTRCTWHPPRRPHAVAESALSAPLAPSPLSLCGRERRRLFAASQIGIGRKDREILDVRGDQLTRKTGRQSPAKCRRVNLREIGVGRAVFERATSNSAR